MKLFTDNEMNLLEQANVYIENKETYTSEEKQKISFGVMEFIMSQSSKNMIIDNLRNSYEPILEKSR